MEVELLEIRDFLAAHHPFDQLPDTSLSELPKLLAIRYYRRDTAIPDIGSLDDHLYIIRSGAVELRSPDDELVARLGEGDIFGYRTSQQESDTKYRGLAMEDCLLYQLPANEVDTLCDQHAQFAYFFTPVGGERLRGAVAHAGQEADTQLNLMTTPITELLHGREPISVGPDATIREAAQIAATSVGKSERAMSSLKQSIST